MMPRATRAEALEADGAHRPHLGRGRGDPLAARPNRLPAAHRPHLVTRVLGQLRDPMIMMLCAAWAVVLAIGDRQDATIIAAVVVLNTVIGVVQEVRAQRAVDALTELASPRAHVRRDGVVVEVPAADVVPGDLVRLEAGDVVPADLGLVDSSALQVDESAMTGESVPVDRDVGDEVLAGTVVSRGRGWGSVVRTGPDSGLGRVAALVASAAPRPTPLQRRLSILSRQLVVVTAVLCVVVMVLSVLRGASYVDASILAVSLGVAAIPESLPAVVTVALALGAHRMASRSAVVRSLPAVETLGSVTVLASDKTGTLTRGVLVARRLWTPDGSCTVSGDGHDVYGEVVGSEVAEAGAMRLLRDAVAVQRRHAGGARRGRLACRGRPLRRRSARGRGQAGPDRRAAVPSMDPCRGRPVRRGEPFHADDPPGPGRALPRGAEGRSGGGAGPASARPGCRGGPGRGGRAGSAGLTASWPSPRTGPGSAWSAWWTHPTPMPVPWWRSAAPPACGSS